MPTTIGDHRSLANHSPNPYGHGYRPEMAELIPHDAKRLLDIGCNSGGFADGLKQQREIEIWGIEPHPQAAAQARKIVDNLIEGYFDENAPVPDHAFDVIVFNDVLEHMPDPWSALRLARRKLASGGKVVISLPNLLHVENVLHLLLDRDFRYELSGIRDRTHLRFFTAKSARRMVVDCGYQVDSLGWINQQHWIHWLLPRAIMKLLPRNMLTEFRGLQVAIVATPAVASQ